MVQARLTTHHQIVTGYEWTSKRDKKLHHRHWKQCTWCNTHFIPAHNKQKYCSKVCRKLRKNNHNSRWMKHRRMLEREGVIINDKNILNVGTGGLSEHRCRDFDTELWKVRREMKELRLL